ncbi:M56 family metallopeptidase [Algibacter sp. L3A6]|uniref:M56 family metallopeptidase n=1 Tax=Algibacter sp. L3A6 TaxID=2686366 RepID=UPI00131BBA24|nr:M56 family metallopeptidase [Algibacter sp. L3A6]
MIHYIIQTIAFQVFFLLIYDVFLKKETFFNWNRFYLITTAFMSLVLPLVKIASFKHVVPENYIIRLPAVVLGQTEANIKPDNINETILPSSFSFIEFIFYFGVGVVVLLFIYKLSKLVKLIKSNPKEYKNHYIIVKLLNSSASFSFFKYIFLGESLSSEEKTIILKHEIIHVKHWHSLDLMCFELLRVLFWFNPLIYIYQSRITELHEFIADAEAVKIEGKSIYYQSLLAQVFDTKKISFINPFFNQSLIKKRIVMLQKSKSKQVYLFKYALLVPMVFGMLVYTSCADNTGEKEVPELISPDNNRETELVKTVNEVKYQIQIQGDISDQEEKGLDLLLQTIKGPGLSSSLVNDVQEFMANKDETKLTEKISYVFEQIQAKGEVSEAETKALKGLLILTSEDGFNDPFFADVLNDVEIPFGIIDQVPVFPGCEDLESNADKKACMSKGVQKLVIQKFNTDLADDLGLKGRQRINVVFKINNEGDVVDVRARAPHPALSEEAIRVIKTLPKMIPGEQKGKKVNVPYSLPIVFQVQE